MRQAHISQHLMVLRDAGLVTDRRDGWNIFYRVCKPEIFAVLDAMSVLSGEPVRQANSNAGKASCPCPKCNPAAETMDIEQPGLALDKAEAAV